MSYQTNISLPKSVFNIGYDSQILSLGSCFSVHIADRLKALKYSIIQNPCGITFNPLSIFSSIKRCISMNSLLEDDLMLSGALFVHPDFHGSFNNIDPDQYLKNANNSIMACHHFLKNVDIVFITIGTAFVYSLKSGNRPVNNCHKLPADDFDRKLMSQEEIVNALIDAISLIRRFAQKEVQVVLALSPVRHLKDGMIENQKNKATCLLAIHNVCNQMETVKYFPSYEIILDELRDYRFYNDDMIHPSHLAINHVFDHFDSWCLDQNESQRRSDIQKIQNSLNHRPLHPDDPAYAKFKIKLISDMENLEQKYPGLSFSTEIEKLSGRHAN